MEASPPNLSADYWFDPSGLIKQVDQNVGLAFGGSAKVQGNIVMDFSDYGAPVSISAPPANQVESLSGMLNSVTG
jgi:hypothetical protein